MKITLYHIGNLAHDRCRDLALDRNAMRMWREYMAGKCVLVQKRRFPGVCEYWAIPVNYTYLKKERVYDSAGI